MRTRFATWFSDVSLRVKMSFVPSLLLVALLGVSAYALGLLASSGRHMDELGDRAFRRAAAVASLDQQVSAIHARLYELTAVAGNDADAGKVEATGNALAKDVAAIAASVAAVREAIGADAEAQPLMEGVGTALKAYVEAAQQVIGMASNPAYALIFMNAARQAYDSFAQQEADLGTLVEGEKASLIAGVKGEMVQGRMVFLAIAGLAAILSVAFTVLLGRLIAQPIIALAAVIHRLAGGELAVAIPAAARRDEVGTMAKAVEARHGPDRPRGERRRAALSLG